MDSAVVLAIAREAGFDVHALSVRYGQRHTSELAAAARVASALGAVVHKTVHVDLRSIGGSALTDDIEVPTDDDGHEIGGHPVHLRAGAQHHHAVGGAGLGRGAGREPTCSAASTRWTIRAIRTAARNSSRPSSAGQPRHQGGRGRAAGIRVHAPLMRMGKADIVREGLRLGVDFAQTVSCYQADAEGRACGHCDACRLRAQGFAEAGVPTHALRAERVRVECAFRRNAGADAMGR
jgi:7-cyano-7-deazaguanine synthase